MGKYFGTDGFRGEANIDLTVEHAYKVGRFLGWYFGKDHKAQIVIGKDTRRSSYMFEYSLVAGLTASGADAYLLHVTTTPSVSYVVRTENFDCGIMISASHNPFYDNGIKVINGLGQKLEADIEAQIEAYIDDVYVDEYLSAPGESMRMRLQRRYLEKAKATEAEPEECCAPSMASDARLDDMLSQVDESFAQMLIRKIDERHMTDAQCYKRANVDRRLFNKIKNIPDYKPSKQTALAFAIALELSLDETKDMLMKAGFALSHSSKADIVVEYCIMTGNYDIMEINQILFGLDLQPLGY